MATTTSTVDKPNLGSLDIDALKEQHDVATLEIKGYELEFVLNTPKILDLEASENPISWNSIKFNKDQSDFVPNDKRGIYAFIISDKRDFLPPNGYIMYIGIAGKNSERSLRDRYNDYFKQSEIKARPRLRRMIAQWNELLWFHFAPVEDDFSSTDLQALERRLITAFLPPCCKDDVESDTRRSLDAFQ